MKNLSYLDLGIGEARCVKEVACRHYDLDTKNITIPLVDWEYNSSGLPELVNLLEEKHKARVIITNGANQGLHASLYALKATGKNKIGIRLPCWNRIPDMIKSACMDLVPMNNGLVPEVSEKDKLDSVLLVGPNNPDGTILPQFMLRNGFKTLQDRKIPLIHDAAYYTNTYMPKYYRPEPLGDMQIFSISKAYGLSALRLGYIVVHNDEYYKYLHHYVEYSTVGASAFAQHLLIHILKREKSLSFIKEKFEDESRQELYKSKDYFKLRISQKHIEIAGDHMANYGMFAWVKEKTPDVLSKLNIGVIPGHLFGKPGHARINLAAGFDKTKELVERINDFEKLSA